jgi:hypothetical protein
MSRGASRPSSTYSVPTHSEKIEGFPSFDDRRIPILIDGQSIDTPAELATFDLTGFARSREIGGAWLTRRGSKSQIRRELPRPPSRQSTRPSSTHNAISIWPTPSSSQGSLSQATRFANAASAPSAPLRPRPSPQALGGERPLPGRPGRAGAFSPDARRANDFLPFRAFLTDSGVRFFERRAKGSKPSAVIQGIHWTCEVALDFGYPLNVT